ncbi:MAG: hypothetical protein AAFQ22_13200 [Pseudomonadota bacterium]
MTPDEQKSLAKQIARENIKARNRQAGQGCILVVFLIAIGLLIIAMTW